MFWFNYRFRGKEFSISFDTRADAVDYMEYHKKSCKGRGIKPDCSVTSKPLYEDRG